MMPFSIRKLYFVWLAVFLFSAPRLIAQARIGNLLYEFSNDANFGEVVSMGDANTIAVNAPGDTENGPFSGSVQVFEWNGNQWSPKGNKFLGLPHQQLALDICMPDGQTLAFGEELLAPPGIPEPRKLSVYTWNGAAWVQKGQSIIFNVPLSGHEMTISMPNSNTVAVSLPRTNFNNLPAVFVFAWNGSSWVQKGTPLLGNHGTEWGRSISMPDDSTLAIGSELGNTSQSLPGTFVFQWSGTDWVPKGSPILAASSSDREGYSVDMAHSNILVTAAPDFDANPGTGRVRIFEWNGNTWVQKGQDLTNTFPSGLHKFGISVGMPDQNHIAVSNYAFGGVHLYRWNGTSWQIKTPSILDLDAPIRKGMSIPDTNTIGIGYSHFVQTPSGNTSFGTVGVFSFCKDAMIDSVKACNSFQWIDGNTYTSSNYQAQHTFTNVWGCDSTITLHLDLITQNTHVDSYGTNSLISQSSTSEHQWLDCQNNFAPITWGFDQLFTTIYPGSYAVQLTEGWCVDTSSCYTLLGNVGLSTALEPSLNLFPNPAKGYTQVQLSDYSLKGGEEIQVLDSFGRVVLSQIMDKNPQDLNLWQLSLGTYFIVVSLDNKQVRLPLIIF